MTNCARIPGNRPPHRSHGLSLIELMIAIALGLIVLAAVTTAFVSSSRARQEMEKSSQQIENGRYAMQVLFSDLQMAGYLGEFAPTVLASPASKPDPCSTTPADLKSAVPLHIQGYDNGAAPPGCISDVRAGTDIFVVRRASTCVAGSAGCAAVSPSGVYFQTTRCETELADPSIPDFVVSNIPGDFTLTAKNCTTPAALYQYLTRIYYVANNNRPGDGIPTLKRAELIESAFTVVPLAVGIEQLQVEYGIDTDNDGTPNAYSADPDTYAGCSGAACVENWRNAMTLQVHLIARNTESSAGFTDTRTYTLGRTAAGSGNVFGPFNDAVKRHAYNNTIRLNNPAGRRE